MSFHELGLSAKTLSAVTVAGYKEPTPIQAQAIPLALAGRDVVGLAQTGTGKTGAFVLPLLTKLEHGRARARMPRSLILEPTRELAAQVVQAIDTLGTQHKLNVALLIGGVSFSDQERKLERGVDVLIATPGRLLDHAGRGKLLLSAVEVFVIDEADRMLDMGFIPDIERICSLLPTKRQTLFFSATMPPEIRRLTDKFLNNPERISVSPPSSVTTTITQRLKLVGLEPAAKREALRGLLRENASTIQNAIIFCNRKRDVALLHRSLLKHGYNAGALHGDLDQRQRTNTLEAFRRGDIKLLAASDVAARGLDIPEVSHVFNFDVPISPEDYVHRIGRTGRAGREGYAAMLVTPSDLDNLKAIEKLVGKAVEWIDGPPDPELFAQGAARRRRGGAGRGRSAAVAPEPKAAARERPAASPERRRPASAATDAAPPAERKRREDSPAAEGKRDVKRPAPGRRNATALQTAAVADATGAPANMRLPAKPRQERPRRERGEPRDASVVGLGEHTPAFLMRPVKKPTSVG